MCGINGFISFKNEFNKQKMLNIVHSMNEQIIHRGPNDEGLYADDHCALGMRRLSIIDLEGGNQPIWNEDHTKMIIFNGEIYNYKTVKQDLINLGHHFSTNSDTETVLHGFEEYGMDILDKIEGMFCFVIYDTVKTEWIIARDRVGEKPLYYFKTDFYFIFASELKSLIATGLIPKKIDYEALSTYFQLTYIPAPKTIFEGVCKLPAATVMVIKNDGVASLNRYWNLKTVIDNAEVKNYETCKTELRQKLFTSVEQRMNSDVPLGAFLSGGFDSSIIVGIMSQISDKPINTFTIGYKEKQFDESELAAIVAKKNNTNHTTLMLDWDNALSDVEHLLSSIDEPYADSSLIASYVVSKLTKEHVTVALSGDAGDELFAGYNKYLVGYYGDRYKAIPGFLRKGIINPAISLLPTNSSLSKKAKKLIDAAELDDFERIIRLMSLGFKKEEMLQLMPGFAPGSLDFIRSQYDALKKADSQTRTQYIDFMTVLEGDMLPKVDRSSMLASLEMRAPLLDRGVIELAYSMPSEYKIKGKERKIILKDTFRDLLPDELFSAPKHGFMVPIGKWLAKDLRDRLEYYASREFIEEQGLFDFGYLNGVVGKHLSGQEDRFSELWAFFVFQNWYERVMA